MNYSFLSLFLLLYTSLLVAEVTVSITKKNSLVLRAKSCDILEKEYKAICDWKKTVNSEFSVPPEEKPYCRTLSSGKKQIIISKCLPKLVKSYQRKRHYKDGPNCWGTAMNLKGISLVPRFVWSKEMVYWQDSPICRRLGEDENVMPGDIINVYGPEYIFDRNEYSKGTTFFETLYPGGLTPAPVKLGYSGYHNLLHSETYISKHISFGKESPNKQDRFLVKSLNETYGRSQDKECQENQSMVPNLRVRINQMEEQRTDLSRTRCRGYFSNAYRCENFNRYFKRNLVNSEQRKLYDKIEELKLIQKELFKLQMKYGYRVSRSKVVSYLRRVDNEANESLKALERPMDKTTEMLHALRYFSAHGIRKTLEYAGLTKATELL